MKGPLIPIILVSAGIVAVAMASSKPTQEDVVQKAKFDPVFREKFKTRLLALGMAIKDPALRAQYEAMVSQFPNINKQDAMQMIPVFASADVDKAVVLREGEALIKFFRSQGFEKLADEGERLLEQAKQSAILQS